MKNKKNVSLASQCKRMLATVLFVTVVSLFFAIKAIALPAAEEAALDRQIGILDRPWRINLIRIATRDYLRNQAQIKTGLPAYDQLVEGARYAPQVLYDLLNEVFSVTPPEPSGSNYNPQPTPAPGGKPDPVDSPSTGDPRPEPPPDKPAPPKEDPVAPKPEPPPVSSPPSDPVPPSPPTGINPVPDKPSPPISTKPPEPELPTVPPSLPPSFKPKPPPIKPQPDESTGSTS